MPRPVRTYQLTAALVASAVGAGVLCLAPAALGRSYRLHASRPGPELNRRIVRAGDGFVACRADTAPTGLDLPSGAAHVVAPVQPALIRVDVVGGLEQRAGYHDPCAGWTDGHDAIAERLCAAFEQGDVLLVVDSPGGAAAGLAQGVDRALKAKAKHGRRVTVWANEMIGSAAYWWAAALGDELFVPGMGQLGSVGARAKHDSYAAALAKEGVETVYFADPPDKIAFAPEYPLSPVAAARGNRDTKIAADAFRAAVVASPIGRRRGLTPEALVELGADMLTGQAAVDAGLADGVASEDEVIAYALRLAERGAEKSAAPAARARGESMKKGRRAEDGKPVASDGEGQEYQEPTEQPKPGAEEEGDEEEAESTDPGDEDLDPPGDEEPPPSSKRIPPVVPVDRARAGSVAEILGLPADASVVAQRSAALDLRAVYDHAAKLTGQTSAANILGGLTALANDAAASGRLRKERDDMRRTQAHAERWALARRLVALGVPGYERGQVFLDAVNEDGSRKLDARTGKPVLTLAPVIAEMRLGTLRGLVEGHEKNAPRRNPFEPDRERAEAASKGAKHGDRTARIERAKTHPKVIEMANRPGQTLSIDKLAASFVAQDFDL